MSVATELAGEVESFTSSPLATVGRRLGAYAIDFVLAGITAWMVVQVAGNPAAFELVFTLVFLLYLAGFEGSRLQATPGKLLVGIKVVSASGRPISFRRALARNVAKIPTAGIGFFIRLIRDRPAWHDALASTVVVRRGGAAAAIQVAEGSARIRRGIGWGIVGILFALLLFNGADRGFTFRVYIVGNAMAPAYADGRHVTVEKFSYLVRSPQRGDVIAFRTASCGCPHALLLGRIVGLPGETIEVRNAVVRINGRVLNEPYEAQPPAYSWGPETVPPGKYFVLADNRNDAFDSHNWPVSPWVSRGEILGRVWS